MGWWAPATTRRVGRLPLQEAGVAAPVLDRGGGGDAGSSDCRRCASTVACQASYPPSKSASASRAVRRSSGWVVGSCSISRIFCAITMLQHFRLALSRACSMKASASSCGRSSTCPSVSRMSKTQP